MATAARLRTAGWHDEGRDGSRLVGAAACAVLLHASLGALVLLGPWRGTPAPVLPEGVTFELAALPSAGEDQAPPKGTTEGEAADAPEEAAAPVAPPPMPQPVPPAPALPAPPPIQLAAAFVPPAVPMPAMPALVPLDLALPPPVETLGDIAPTPPSAAESPPAPPRLPQPAPVEAAPEPPPFHAAEAPVAAPMTQVVPEAPRDTAVADALPLPPPVMPAPPPVAAARPPAPSRIAERAAPRGIAEGTPEARPLARGGGPDSLASGGAVPSDDPPLIVAPRFRRPPRPPEYPRRAVELDLTGTVVVRALLDPEGDPREMRVHRSSGHPLLDSAALMAVRGWAFQPASRNGQRIHAWVEVPVHFRLH